MNEFALVALAACIGYILGRRTGETRAYRRGLDAGSDARSSALTKAYGPTWKRDLDHIARLRHQQRVRQAAPWN